MYIAHGLYVFTGLMPGTYFLKYVYVCMNVADGLYVYVYVYMCVCVCCLCMYMCTKRIVCIHGLEAYFLRYVYIFVWMYIHMYVYMLQMACMHSRA
jgi:hypothetical protein